MRRDEALAILVSHQEELRALGVKSLALFGSVARDEARPESDVDLLVELDYDRLPAWGSIDLRLHLKSLLKREVDLTNPNLLKPRLRERILGEAIPILSVPKVSNIHDLEADTMPRKDPKAYIDDILKAAAKVKRYTEGLSFEEFLVDERTTDAVLRNLTIIGEAVSTQKLPQEIQKRHPQIEWAKINEVRNILVHQYDEVDLQIIWRICQDSLPRLVPQLQNLLELEQKPK